MTKEFLKEQIERQWEYINSLGEKEFTTIERRTEVYNSAIEVLSRLEKDLSDTSLKEALEKIKMSKNFLHIQGLHKVKYWSERCINEINPDNPYVFDGYKLDEVQINAVITDVAGLDRLIDTLKIARNCLLGGKPVDRVLEARKRLNKIDDETELPNAYDLNAVAKFRRLKIK